MHLWWTCANVSIHAQNAFVERTRSCAGHPSSMCMNALAHAKWLYNELRPVRELLLLLLLQLGMRHQYSFERNQFDAPKRTAAARTRARMQLTSDSFACAILRGGVF